MKKCDCKIMNTLGKYQKIWPWIGVAGYAIDGAEAVLKHTKWGKAHYKLRMLIHGAGAGLLCLGAGDGFIDAIVDGGYRWIGYGVAITVLPLIIVALVARLWLKMNYYTLMGLIAGSTTDPPALAYANATAGNDMPAVGYSTVYPVVMFLRVLTAQIFILFSL